MQKEFEIAVEWKAFPLHPNTPPQGLTLEELFNASSAKIMALVAGLKQTAAGLGLPFGNRTKTFNSRLAQELGLWAEDQGGGAQFHQLAFKFYFVQGENLADRAVLRRLAIEAGLSGHDAEEVISSRSYAPRVDAHWREARELGITAVPTFLSGFNRVVGAQGYETLAELIMMAGGQRKG